MKPTKGQIYAGLARAQAFLTTNWRLTLLLDVDRDADMRGLVEAILTAPEPTQEIFTDQAGAQHPVTGRGDMADPISRIGMIGAIAKMRGQPGGKLVDRFTNTITGEAPAMIWLESLARSLYRRGWTPERYTEFLHNAASMFASGDLPTDTE